MSRPLFIALGGGSGSGKSTFARSVCMGCGDLNISVLNQDHYYKDLSHLPSHQRESVNFDHPDALDTGLLFKHMSKLREGSSVERPRYDFASHTRLQNSVPLQPGQALLFDGIFSLYYKEITKLFDLRLYLDAPDDIRFIRRLRRDQHERGRSLESITEQYENTVRPGFQKFIAGGKEHADLVIPMHRENSVAARMISAYIISNA